MCYKMLSFLTLCLKFLEGLQRVRNFVESCLRLKIIKIIDFFLSWLNLSLELLFKCDLMIVFILAYLFFIEFPRNIFKKITKFKF